MRQKSEASTRARARASSSWTRARRRVSWIAVARIRAARARAARRGSRARSRIAPNDRARRERCRRARSRARSPRQPQLLRPRHRCGQEQDLRAPPRPALVALRLVRHHAGGLQVIEPPLHAAAMRPHEPRPLGALTRNRPPAHHRRQPRDQLLDRTREPARPRRVTQAEQVALDRIGARLEPIVTRRRAPACPPRAAQQRGDDQPAWLGRDRPTPRAIPATS